MRTALAVAACIWGSVFALGITVLGLSTVHSVIAANVAVAVSFGLAALFRVGY